MASLMSNSTAAWSSSEGVSCHLALAEQVTNQVASHNSGVFTNRRGGATIGGMPNESSDAPKTPPRELAEDRNLSFVPRDPGSRRIVGTMSVTTARNLGWNGNEKAEHEVL